MNLWFPILAKIKTDGGLLENNAISSSVREVAVVIFGLVVIAICLMLWAGFIRKRRHHLYSGGQRRRRHHSRHHHHHSDDKDATAKDEEVTSSPQEEGSRRIPVPSPITPANAAVANTAAASPPLPRPAACLQSGLSLKSRPTAAIHTPRINHRAGRSDAKRSKP